MKMKPIIFNSESIRAILDGRKTQTRRVIKPQPKYRAYLQEKAFHIPKFGYIAVSNSSALKEHMNAPYGKVSDVLWARETWMLYNHMGTFNGKCPEKLPYDLSVGYKADEFDKDNLFTWRSPIHIPKWAARIFLEITNIRVEKVQDISEEDARSEGCCFTGINPSQAAIAEFMLLWDSINKKRGYGWDMNPWCWCVEFKRTASVK